MKNFGLSRNERIKSKNEFDLVFSKGKVVYSSGLLLKAKYLLLEGNGFKVAFTIHKKAGKAFWRNRARRLMKDIFRVNKATISTCCSEKQLLIVFSLNLINQKKFPHLEYNFIKPELIDILNKLQKELVN